MSPFVQFGFGEAARAVLRPLCLAFAFALVGALRAESPPEPVWVSVPASTGPSGFATQIRATATAVDAAGNSIVVGTFQGTSFFGTNSLVAGGFSGTDEIFLVKHGAAGEVLWARRAGGSGHDRPRALALDASGDFYVTGECDGENATFGTNVFVGFGNSLFVAKYGSDGTCHWVRRAGAWTSERNITQQSSMTAAGLGIDPEGRVVVGGVFTGQPQFGGVATNRFLPYNFSGGLILTNSSPVLTADLFLAKYDAGGTLLWARNHGGTNNETLESLALDAAGAVYLAGSFTGSTVLGGSTHTNIPTQPGPFVAKFDALGTPVWSSSLGEATNNRSASAHSLTVTPSGLATVLFLTKTSPYRIGSLSITNLETAPDFSPVSMSLLARFDAAGSIVWLKKTPFHVTGNGVVAARSTLSLDAETNSYVAGHGYWNLSPGPSASAGLTVAKYDAQGVGLWTNLISRGASSAFVVSGRRLLGIDGARNLYFAATLSGDKPDVVPIGWTNVANAFTNGFGANMFLVKITNAFWPVLPEFIQAPTNMVFQPPRGLTNSTLARAWPVADYRWYMNSNGAIARIGTNRLLTLGNSTVTNVTTYYAVASNHLGSVTSVVVFATPQLAILPVTQRTNSILLGGSGSLSVEALGTTEISYQWRFNGTNLVGATGPTLALNGVATNAAGLYTVVACNAWGCVTSAPAITVRVIPPGSVDGTFTTALTGEYGLARLSDGRLLGAGGGIYPTLFRAQTNGVFDTNFYLRPPSDGGTYAWWRTGNFDQQGPRAFVVEPDGSLVVGGNFTRFFTNYPSGNWATVGKMVRLNPDGTLASTFNVGSGPSDPSDAVGVSGINALVRQPDGKIVAVGWFRNFNGAGRTNVVRLNTDGSVDTAFAGQTYAYGNDYNNTGGAHAVALQPDGKILVGGIWQRVSGQDRPVLVRLNADGTLDDTFAVMRRKDGSSTWPANGFCSVSAILVLPSGKILIAGNGLLPGQTGYDNRALFQLNADGTVDTGFVPVANGFTASHSLAVQSDGKILLGGSGPVNRFLPDGSRDPIWQFDPSLPSPITQRILIEPGGATALMAGSYGVKRILLNIPAGVVSPPNVPAGSAARLPNGQFGFTTCGVTGQTLVIEASTDLGGWTPISTNVVTDGCIDFVDTQAPQHPNRFYRVIVRP